MGDTLDIIGDLEAKAMNIQAQTAAAARKLIKMELKARDMEETIMTLEAKAADAERRLWEAEGELEKKTKKEQVMHSKMKQTLLKAPGAGGGKGKKYVPPAKKLSFSHIRMSSLWSDDSKTPTPKGSIRKPAPKKQVKFKPKAKKKSSLRAGPAKKKKKGWL